MELKLRVIGHFYLSRLCKEGSSRPRAANRSWAGCRDGEGRNEEGAKYPFTISDVACMPARPSNTITPEQSKPSMVSIEPLQIRRDHN